MYPYALKVTSSNFLEYILVPCVPEYVRFAPRIQLCSKCTFVRNLGLVLLYCLKTMIGALTDGSRSSILNIDAF